MWSARLHADTMTRCSSHRNSFLIRKLACLEILIWYPLYLGILSAAVGSFFSVPGALDPGSNAAQFHKTMRRPLVINAITIGLPLALTACIAPLCVLAQLSRTRQLDHYLDFAHRINDSITASTINDVGLDSNLVQSYLQEASNLWSESAQNRWTRAGWSVWNAFYCFLFLFYSFAGGWMLVVVKRQVDASKAIADKEEKYQRELLVAHRDDTTALLFQPLLSPVATATPITTLGMTSNSSSTNSPSVTATALSSPSTACSPLQSEKKFMQSDDVEATAVAAPDQMSLPLSPAPQAVESQPPPTPASVLRWRYLRRCYRSLVIMYAGIMAVIAVSIVTGAYVAASGAREWLKGPYESAYVLSVYIMLQTWSRVVFGSITLGAVVFRSFDHSAMSGASSGTASDKRDVPAPASGRSPIASVANGGSAAGTDTVSSAIPRAQVLQDPVGSQLASVPEDATTSPRNVDTTDEVELNDIGPALLTEPILPTTDTGDVSSPPAAALTESHDLATEADNVDCTAALLPQGRRSIGNALAPLSLPQSPRSGSAGKLDALARPSSSHSVQSLAFHAGASFDSRARRFSASVPPPNRPLPTPVPRAGMRPESASSTSSSFTTRQRRGSNSISLAQRRASANAELAPAARLLQLATTSESRRGSCLITPEYTPADRTGWRSFVPEDCQGTAPSPFRADWSGFAPPAAVGRGGRPDSALLFANQQPVTVTSSGPPSPAATDASSGEIDHLSELIPRSKLTERANASKSHTESSSPSPDSPVDSEAFRFEQNTP